MIWIVFFHIPLLPKVPFLAFVKKLGYGGVDLCLFASGAGCFCSQKRDSDAGRFIVRRFWRLAPVYLVFMAFWIPWKLREGYLSIPSAIGNLFGIQYLTALNADFNWYVSAIVVFYFLAPYLKAFLNGASRRGRVLLLMILLVLVIPFWMSGEYIVLVTRLPVFYMGMLFASGAEEERVVKPWQMGIGVAMIALGMYVLGMGYEYIPDKMWPYGVYWCPFILIAPPMCVILSWLMTILERCRPGKKVIAVLSWLGQYSFEIYLIHFPLMELLPEWIQVYGLKRWSGLLWIAGICGMLLMCLLLRRTAELLVRWIRRT